MLYHVLIVDDEPRHRRGMVNLLKYIRDDVNVSEAKNGKEALEHILIQDVDILITDIMMPIMDGLELIEKIGSRISKMKVIILSAYGYFEYAQKAVNLGAFDYILKPVNREKIEQMLQKAIESLEQERVAIKEKEKLKEQLENALPAYMAHLLNRWVHDTLTDSELSSIKSWFNGYSSGWVIACDIGNNESLISDYLKEEQEEIRVNINYWLSKILSELGICMLFYNGDQKTLLTAILASNDGITQLQVVQNLKRIISTVKDMYAADISFGIGNRMDDMYEQVKNSYKQARTALDYQFYTGTCSVLEYTCFNTSANKPFPNLYTQQNMLEDAIRKLDKNEAFKITDGLHENMTGKYYYPPSQYISAITFTVLNIYKSFQSMIPDKQHLFIPNDIVQELSECKYSDELIVKIKKIILGIIDELEVQKSKKNEIMIDRCLNYIEEHYSEDIRLDTVAEMLYFNPSYFSTLFKSYTGVNFSQYVLKIRMKNAKQMLQKTAFKVYDISSRVGFNGTKYFIRVFKKETGMTPDDYRRAVLEGRLK